MQDLNFDQHLCARQIAICTSPKVTDTENKPVEGLAYYRASDYIFNFGQYVARKSGDSIHYEKPSTTDIYDASLFPDTSPPENKILDFTLPYKFDATGTILYPTEADLSTSAARKFNFILHDYILGNRRDAHSADRIGYVIGF